MPIVVGMCKRVSARRRHVYTSPRRQAASTAHLPRPAAQFLNASLRFHYGLIDPNDNVWNQRGNPPKEDEYMR